MFHQASTPANLNSLSWDISCHYTFDQLVLAILAETMRKCLTPKNLRPCLSFQNCHTMTLFSIIVVELQLLVQQLALRSRRGDEIKG